MSRPILAQIHLAHLSHNYRLLRDRAAPAHLMAVVKADAYGHGLELVAPVLSAAGCSEFAVTDAAEGLRLRQILDDDKVGIALLSGVFDLADARDAAHHHLHPVIYDQWQVELLRRAGFAGSVWLKVETGMHRLGAFDASQLFDAVSRAGIRMAGIMSHLACADTPDHPLNAEQVGSFTEIRSVLGDSLPASLLNSAGIATMRAQQGDVVRPGIALYGVEPVDGLKLGLKPVMRFSSRIMHIHELAAGDCVSYGATYSAKAATRIAVVAAGYADGLPRSLSNRGTGIWRGRQLPITGRVCMDFCMLNIGEYPAAIGDNVEFWGTELRAADVARQAGTIAYELFTAVGGRVPRLGVETFA